MQRIDNSISGALCLCSGAGLAIYLMSHKSVCCSLSAALLNSAIDPVRAGRSNSRSTIPIGDVHSHLPDTFRFVSAGCSYLHLASASPGSSSD